MNPFPPIEQKDEEKNQKLREKIQNKKEQYERNKTEILNAKREKAAELSSGNLYSSLEIENMNGTRSAMNMNGTRSLPNSPRVNSTANGGVSVHLGLENTQVKSSSSTHIRNLFKKSGSQNDDRKTRHQSAAADLIEARSSVEGETREDDAEKMDNTNQHEAKTTPVEIKHENADLDTNLSDPASLYFITEKSIENLEKIADFEKMLKKRLKKIKTRMTTRYNKLEDFEASTNNSKKLKPSANRNKISKNLKEIEKAINCHDNNVSFWPDQRIRMVERACKDLIKLLSMTSNKQVLDTEMQTFKGFFSGDI